MAKETKAQKVARENAEKQAEYEKYLAQWLPSLMAVFDRMRDYGFELQVINDEFYVFSDTHEFYEYYPLTFEIGSFNHYRWKFNELIDTLDLIDREKAKAERKRELRANAMDKLTYEEQEALGLV